MKAAATVSIIEDDAEARQIFAQWISTARDFTVLSEHGAAEAAIEALPALAPDIVLADINLPGLSGVEGVRRLKPLLPATQFVMLTVYEDGDHIFEALANGATGYLLKHTAKAELIAALREVFDGGSPMSSKIARKVVQAFQRRSEPDDKPKAELAPRERELVELLAKGYLYKEIAEAMQISVGTVNTYIRRVYEKLHVHSRGQAVAKISQIAKRSATPWR